MSFLLALVAVSPQFVISPHIAHADEKELETTSTATDVVLLVDASGSMLLTDPLKLRYEGAKLLLQFLGSEDRLAIVAFSRDATVVQDLQPFSSDQAASVISKIEAIKSEGTYTDLLEAVKAGKKLLEASPRESAQRVMVLLSDGKMEPDPSIGFASGRTQDLVSNYLPELKASETKIHTLAFSDQADRALLAEIAGATDGLSWFTITADEIHKSFADLFLAVKRPQVVPLTSKGFKIDDDVTEATFYITREEGAKLTLRSPKNETYTAESPADYMTWFQGQRFDVITMKEPESGNWQVEGVTATDGEAFATVLTNLKLVTNWPSVIRSEDLALIQARLYEGEKPVALPEMSGVIRYAFQIAPTDKISEPIVRDALVDDGTHGDRSGRDGIFSKALSLAEPGEYRLTVIARGPTFQRTQQMPFRVRPRIVSLSVDPPGEHGAIGHGGKHEGDHAEDGPAEVEVGRTRVVKGNENYIIRVTLSSEAASFKKVEVKVTARDAERKRFELPLKRSIHDPLVYEFPASGLPADGQYMLEASVKAQSKKHQDVEASGKPVVFHRISEGGDEASSVELKVVVEDKPVTAEAEEPTSNFPLLPLLVVTLGNAGLGFAGYQYLKKGKSKGPAVTGYAVPAELTDLVVALEQRVAMTEVDLSDPMFANLDDTSSHTEPEPLNEEPARESESQSKPQPETTSEDDSEAAPSESEPESESGTENEEKEE